MPIGQKKICTNETNRFTIFCSAMKSNINIQFYFYVYTKENHLHSCEKQQIHRTDMKNSFPRYFVEIIVANF